MTEHFPSEDDISSALLDSCSDIFDMYDVLRFLHKTDLKKSNSTRFLCYMIGLKKLSAERTKWIPEILKYGEMYERCTKRRFGNKMDSPIVDSAIEKEIEDKFIWFAGFAHISGIDQYFIKDSKMRIKRMFSLLLSEDLNYVFKEQDVSICYLSYLLGLSFAKGGAGRLFFAEAMGFYLFRGFLSILSFNKKLEDLKYSDEHIKKLNELTHRFAPELEKAAALKNVDLYELTKHWENGFFTDVHSPFNLLLIIDNIVFHMDEYHYFMRFLYVAHFRNMEDYETDIASKESIENTIWNATDILEDVEDMIQADLTTTKFGFTRICPCFLISNFFKKPKKYRK